VNSTAAPALDAAPAVLRPAAVPRDAAWVFKRAAIGLAVLVLFALGGALLLDASIDPVIESEYAASPREG
jgi:hypothetical protein